MSEHRRRAPERKPRRARARRGRVAVVAAVPLGILASGAMVWQASYAAFTSQTSNTGNSLASGTVRLTNNGTGAAMFTVGNLRPGSSGARCIHVTYEGTLTPSAPVQVYASTSDDTSPLASKIIFGIQQSTTTPLPAFTSGTTECSAALSAPADVVYGVMSATTMSGNASNLLSGFLAKKTYSPGGTATSSVNSNWTPTGANQVAAFKFYYKVPDDLDDTDSTAPTSPQGKTITFTVNWEARS